MRTLSVWGGNLFNDDGKQVRALVVAPTKKRAVELGCPWNGVSLFGAPS